MNCFVITGGIGAIITFAIYLYWLVTMFRDKSKSTDEFYDVVLGMFGMPIAVFMFGPFILLLAIFTSPIWIIVLIRNRYIKHV